VLVGFYGGFIQAGVGFLIIAFLTILASQFTLVERVCQVFTGAALTVRFGFFFKIYPSVVFCQLPLQADAFRGHGPGLLPRIIRSLRGPGTRACPAGVAALRSSQSVFHASKRLFLAPRVLSFKNQPNHVKLSHKAYSDPCCLMQAFGHG